MSRVAPAPDDFDDRIAALEREKATAVSREDYGQAHSLKGQIEALKVERSEARAPTTRRLAELQQQKADAVALEDYERAQQLQAEISSLQGGFSEGRHTTTATTVPVAVGVPVENGRPSAAVGSSVSGGSANNGSGGCACCGVPCCAGCNQGAQRRRRQMATQSSSVDGAANGVQPLDQLPLPVATVATPQPGVSSASLKAGEALALPLDAIHVVSRVFLGVGWRAESAAGDENVGAIDVDCLAAPYAQGVRGQADTVWYGNLMSSERPSVSVRHTGDIRAGQSSGSGSSGNGGAELEDLERIYVDLSSLPKQYDCVALEASTFNRPSFASLSECYIRLVNADTNQELMRCSIQGPEAKRFLHSKHLLLAKLFRGTDRWTVHAALEARDKSVREPGLNPDHDPNDPAVAQQVRVESEFIPPVGLAPEPTNPNMDGVQALTIDRGDDNDAKKRRAKRPENTYLVGGLAVATAAGIAASIALFHANSSLTPDSLAATNFESGVDFSHLVGSLEWQGTCGYICADLGCRGICGFLPACDGLCCGLGDGNCSPLGCVDGFASCADGAAAACVVGAEDCLGNCVAFLGGALENIGNGCPCGPSDCPINPNEAVGACGEVCGSCGGACSAVVGVAQECGGALGDCGGAVVGVCTSCGPAVVGGCGQALSGIGDCLSGGGAAIEAIGKSCGGCEIILKELAGIVESLL